MSDRDVATAIRWANDMVMVFDDDGEQIAELQGEVTPERLTAIRDRSRPDTEWVGFGEDGPARWPSAADA